MAQVNFCGTPQLFSMATSYGTSVLAMSDAVGNEAQKPCGGVIPYSLPFPFLILLPTHSRGVLG